MITTEDSTPQIGCQSLWITRFKHRRDTQGNLTKTTVAGLAMAICSTPEFAADTQGKTGVQLWSPAYFKGPRRAANVTELSCLVLDIDGFEGTLSEALSAVMDNWGAWDFVVHTTWSNRGDGFVCLRVVLPLAVPCPVELWGAFWAWAAGRDCLVNPDPQCKDPSRIYFVPTAQPGQCWVWGCSAARGAEIWGAASAVQNLDELPERFGETPLDWRKFGLKPRQKTEVVSISPTVLPAGILALREIQRRFKTSPEARLALGLQLGGVQRDGYVAGIICPKCGRASVWLWIDPVGPSGRNQVQAVCHHLNSCKGRFWPDQLAGYTRINQPVGEHYV